MKTLIRLITLRHLRLEPLRSALMILGIALGVAVFVAVRTLNETTQRAFETIFSAASQGADLLIEGSHAGLDAKLIPLVNATPGVSAASGTLTSYARPAHPPRDNAQRDDAQRDGTQRDGAQPLRLRDAALSGRRFLLLGIPLLDPNAARIAGLSPKDQHHNLSIADPAALALDPRATLITDALAQRDKLKPGDKLQLYTPTGLQTLTIAGTFHGGSLSDGLGGDVLIMNLPAAQAMLQRHGKVDRIALLADDSSPDALRELSQRLRAQLGDAIHIHTPQHSSGRASDMLGSMQLGLSLASLLALLIGQFLIYNTMTTAIVRRRPEIGMLRAIGATRSQLATLWLTEATTYGLLGALLGIALGLTAAQLSLQLFSASVSLLYEAIDLQHIHISPLTLSLGLLSGPAATLLAASLPVREALLIPTVDAARQDLPPNDPTPLASRLAVAGCGLLALMAAATGDIRAPGLLAGAILQLGVTLGFALCAPLTILLVTRKTRRVLAQLAGPPGALAGDNLSKSPLRAGITAAALMVAVGGVLSIAALVTSLEATVSDWLEGVLSGDLYVSASTPLGSQASTPIDRKLEAAFESIDGVAAVQPLRFTFERVDDAPALIIACDMTLFDEHSTLPEVHGTMASALPGLLAGRGLIASENFCQLHNASLGDRIPILTPSGTLELEILLVAVDYSSEHGTVFLDRSTYDRAFQDDRVNTFSVILQPDTSPQQRQAIADLIRQRYGAQYDLFVLDNEAFKAQILTTVQDSFQVSYAMQAVAIGIALLGVITTLFAAVLERTREIGVLRALGAARHHIRLAVITEAALLGAIAGALGTISGLALGYMLVAKITAGAFGWAIPFSPPLIHAAAGLILATTLSALAGLIPAEHATKVNIVEALSYE